MVNNTTLEEIAPFFIVKNLAASIDFLLQSETRFRDRSACP